MGFFDLLFDSRCKICGKKSVKGAVCSECDDELKGLIFVRKCTFNFSDKSLLTVVFPQPLFPEIAIRNFLFSGIIYFIMNRITENVKKIY